jgi:hypothetical protein
MQIHISALSKLIPQYRTVVKHGKIDNFGLCCLIYFPYAIYNFNNMYFDFHPAM